MQRTEFLQTRWKKIFEYLDEHFDGWKLDNLTLRLFQGWDLESVTMNLLQDRDLGVLNVPKQCICQILARFHGMWIVASTFLAPTYDTEQVMADIRETYIRTKEIQEIGESKP